MFEDWYRLYPCKKARSVAEKAYKRAIKKVSHETLLRGLEEYIANKPDWQAWAYPATWLNQGRWEDEYEASEYDQYKEALIRAEQRAGSPENPMVYQKEHPQRRQDDGCFGQLFAQSERFEPEHSGSGDRVSAAHLRVVSG